MEMSQDSFSAECNIEMTQDSTVTTDVWDPTENQKWEDVLEQYRLWLASQIWPPDVVTRDEKMNFSKRARRFRLNPQNGQIEHIKRQKLGEVDPNTGKKFKG